MRGIVRPDRLGIPYEDGGKMFIDAIAHEDLTAGQPYAVHPAALSSDNDIINEDSGALVGGITAAPATLAVLHFVGAPQQDVDSGDIAVIQIGGMGEMLVDGTTDVAIADTLEVLNTATSAVKDGTARSVNTLAFAAEARTDNSAGLIDVFFLGLPVQVAAA